MQTDCIYKIWDIFIFWRIFGICTPSINSGTKLANSNSTCTGVVTSLRVKVSLNARSISQQNTRNPLTFVDRYENQIKKICNIPPTVMHSHSQVRRYGTLYRNTPAKLFNALSLSHVFRLFFASRPISCFLFRCFSLFPCICFLY